MIHTLAILSLPRLESMQLVFAAGVSHARALHAGTPNRSLAYN